MSEKQFDSIAETVLKEQLEASEYIDLFLADLEADEPTIDNPKELLEFIKEALRKNITVYEYIIASYERTKAIGKAN